MLKKILIEIDSKITSEFLYHYALKYAKITKAELWLGLFHKKGKPFQKAESILKKLFLEAEKLNIEVQGFIKEGDRLKELKNIINKEKIDLAFLSMENLNKLLKLPCSIVTSKIINIGKIYPKRILFILKGPITHLKEKIQFIENLSEIFQAKIYFNYFGGDKKIEDFISLLKKQDLRFELEIFSKFSYKLVIFQVLSKKIELLVTETKERTFLEIFKGTEMEKLIKNPPCNIILFKAHP